MLKLNSLKQIMLAFFFLLPFCLLGQADIGTAQENRNIDREQINVTNDARILQGGDYNTANLDIRGMQVAGEIRQLGVYHTGSATLNGNYSSIGLNQINENQFAILNLSGDNSVLTVSQSNSNNFVSVNLNGDNNDLGIGQNGVDNQLNLNYSNVENLNQVIQQNGTGNNLNINLGESVDGSQLPSSIIQNDYPLEITINSVDGFNAFPVTRN